ncbi:hypothetical protein AV530_008239 [Patagioenas fasciata monilis]|uniref:Uncharacterized protein n=1 Tax=Patagioenas fasciata monilis TaxID=372326 RepID=A0A1V4KV03_PATFA|nr:hypothetical protein AV530_008239 [Patagioenas fasciata monilis]
MAAASAKYLQTRPGFLVDYGLLNNLAITSKGIQSMSPLKVQKRFFLDKCAKYVFSIFWQWDNLKDQEPFTTTVNHK